MSLTLIAAASILVMGVASVSYMISRGTDGNFDLNGKEKTFNREGVMLIVDPKKKTPSTTISEQFRNFYTDSNFSKTVIGNHNDWEEDGGEHYGPSSKDGRDGKSYYYGFYFEDLNNTLTQCQTLKNKDEMTIFVGKGESSHFENTKGLRKLNNNEACPKENYLSTGEFFSGNRRNEKIFKFEDPIFYIF